MIYDRVESLENVHLVFNRTYDLLKCAQAAVVTSGTATLEAALFNVPQVVCYKTSFITYLIAKSLIRVKFISLVNLIAGKEVVRELIQDQLTNESLKAELSKIAIEGPYREKQIYEYGQIRSQLGSQNTSEYLSQLILKYLRN